MNFNSTITFPTLIIYYLNVSLFYNRFITLKMKTCGNQLITKRRITVCRKYFRSVGRDSKSAVAKGLI